MFAIFHFLFARTYFFIIISNENEQVYVWCTYSAAPRHDVRNRNISFFLCRAVSYGLLLMILTFHFATFGQQFYVIYLVLNGGSFDGECVFLNACRIKTKCFDDVQFTQLRLSKYEFE